MDVSPAIACAAKRALIGAGVVMTVAGLIWCAYTGAFVSRAQETNADIVRFEQVRVRSGWERRPVYAFLDAGGHRWEAVADYSPVGSTVGQKIAIVYDPGAPITSMLKSFWGIWLGPLFITAWGVLFLAMVPRRLSRNA